MTNQPALLAHHCTEAGLNDKAVDYWLKAAEQATARHAMPGARLFGGLCVSCMHNGVCRAMAENPREGSRLLRFWVKVPNTNSEIGTTRLARRLSQTNVSASDREAPDFTPESVFALLFQNCPERAAPWRSQELTHLCSRELTHLEIVHGTSVRTNRRPLEKTS